MATKVKWIAVRGAYTIDRVEQTDTSVPYRGTDGKVYTDHMVPAVRIVGYAGDVAVIGVTVAGAHPKTQANFREVMARKVQECGGSWMGRSEASETAKFDRLTDMAHDPKTPKADRDALKDYLYPNTPRPSDY